MVEGAKAMNVLSVEMSAAETVVARELDPRVAQALGPGPVGMEILEASVLPAVILGSDTPQATERRCGQSGQSQQSQQSQQSHQSQQSQQSQQSYSSVNS